MVNVYKRRLQLILAMVGTAGFVLGSGSLVTAGPSRQSSNDEIEIRRNDDSRSEDSATNLVFRSARRPIVVPISFGIVDGGPRIQADALEVVLEQLRDHPRRLVTIEVKGLPTSFNALPRSTRQKLLERGGPEFPARYDRFVAQELVKLLDGVRAERPKSPIAIEGLPFDGDGKNDSLLNERFTDVYSRLSAFVLERGVLVSSRSDEQELVSRMFPNALRIADGRAVIYPLNLGWRLAIEGESLASNELSDDAEFDAPENRQTSDTRSSARDGSAPMMSDLDDLGIAGRGGEQSTIVGGGSTGGSSSGAPSGSASTGVGGNSAAASPTGGSGGSGGQAALPFGPDQQAAAESQVPPADDDAGEEPPADDDAGEEPPADDDAGEEPPADDDAGEEPPADDDAGEEPPADDDAGEEPPADDDAGEEPPADDDWNPDDEVEDPPLGDEEQSGEGETEDGDASEDDPDAPPADDAAEAVVNPVISIGSGFEGLSPVPPSFGPDEETRDRVPIARWNVVPFQRFNGPVNVGVVAFHVNGIERVEFAANGGEWVEARGMSFNPRTGVREFWGTLDPSTAVESVELRACIWPRGSGTPLILQSTDWNASDRSGVSSMFFAGDSGESQTLWVSESGSDSAPGNQDMPLATLSAAISRLKEGDGLSGGQILIGSPGVFEAPSNVGIHSMEGWLTIMAAEDIDASSIRIVPQGYMSEGERSMIRPSIAKVCWRGVSFDMNEVSVYYTEDPSELRPEVHVWFDQCRWFDSMGWEINRPGQSYNVRSGGNRGLYMTDCHMRDMLYGPCGFSLVRGSRIERMSGDSLANVQCVLNTEVIRHHLVIPDFHCDVLQYWGETRNIVVFGLRASDLLGVQNLLFDKTNSSFEDVAIVDVVFENIAGSPIVVKTQFNSRCENFVISHATILDQAVVFREDFEGSSQFVADGVDFINSIFERLDSSDFYASQLPPGLRLDHCHFAYSSSLFDADSPGVRQASFGTIDVGFDGLEWSYSGDALGQVFETGLYIQELHLDDSTPDRGLLTATTVE